MKPTQPLVIVCDWIPPAFGAVGQYALAYARKAAAAGRPTTLIGLGDSDRHEEERPTSGSPLSATLKIVRLSAAPATKSSIIKRGLWALKTNLRLVTQTVRILKKGDDAEIRVTGSPPFLAYLLIIANSLFLRRTLTYRITDFYPETAIAARKAAFLKPAVPIFHWLRRRATSIEVLSECQERRLVEAGIAKSKLNLVRDASPISFSESFIAAERPFGKGDVILLYSGNFGIAHEADTFLEAYRLHVQAGSNRVRLWLNATGAKVQTVVDYCRGHNLPLHVTSPVPLDQLAGLLSSPDAHLVVLDEPFWGLVIPSKIYACIDSGKPVLYVGPSESDLHLLTSARTGSFSVRNRDVDGCLAALNHLGAGADRELVLASGSSGSGPGR